MRRAEGIQPLSYLRLIRGLRVAVAHAPGPESDWILTAAIHVLEGMHALHLRELAGYRAHRERVSQAAARARRRAAG